MTYSAAAGEFYPTQDSALLSQFNFVPGLPELLQLRQVHALEHATVWVLSEAQQRHDDQSLGGFSTPEGFFLYGAVKPDALRRAAQRALHRIQGGEWQLAVHPRCGTNLSVQLLLTAGCALGTAALLPKDPLSQLLSFGVATAATASLAPDLGQWAQRYLTTAIPFNLAIAEVGTSHDFWGRPAQFVRVHWQSA
ncbi:MAG: hypothetical protein HC838_06405 [Spirulinaceae cyanobacterium RM2_2_10]|nr:hypothetical protein [Spirulinaceae cyanobacterium SM2_1_0]NJO19764.1 hypothetical protein [Spirulinaceae cyanobacterium RM2_2_10]